MPIDNVKPEQQPNSELKPIDTTSSPNIGNTNVVGSQCHGTLIETTNQKILRQVREMMSAEPDWIEKRGILFDSACNHFISELQKH